MKTDAYLAAPPTGVTIVTLWGVSLQDWVYVVTAVYTLFLIIDKLPSVMEKVGQLYRRIRYGKGQ